MKLITGTGIAASALIVVGGTSAVALSQTASADSPLGVPSSVSPDQEQTDFDATEIDHWKSEAAADDVESDDAGDLGQVEGTEPVDTTDGYRAGAALGQAHAAAMQAWAQCVANAASGQKTMASQTPPKLACGEKPMPPGLAKKMTQQQAVPAPSSVTSSGTESDVPDTHTTESTDSTNSSSWHHSWGDQSQGDHTWGHDGGNHHFGGDHAEGHGD